MTNKLAIDGHRPVRTTSFSPWPCYAADEISSVINTLKSGKVNYWTGNEARKFEEEYARHSGCRYAIALANGTAALELALYALGVGPGDEVVTTSRTFIASASCVVMRGATPVLADVDPVSQNITAQTIERCLTPRTKVIIAVHLAGWPCDMASIMRLARKRNIRVVEDCAQANGATYRGRPVGSLGDIAAFSFCQDKIITTGGEGGMFTTNNPGFWRKAWAYKDHGKSYDAVYKRAHPPGFRWLHESFGTNWRLTEMQAAIGRRQLTKLPEWIKTRGHNATVLSDCFTKIPALRVTTPPKDIGHAYYKYYVFVRPELLRKGWSRDRVMNAIAAEGIPCYSGSCSEIYLEKAFKNMRPETRLPVAKQLGETSLMFLVHPTLSKREISDTCQSVVKVLSCAAIS